MPPPKPTQMDRILRIARESGIIRPRDLDAQRLPRESLRRLLRSGLLVRVGRGLYVLPGAEVTQNHSLAQAAKRVPAGVICLLSSLRFHELTTQAPFEVWIAIDVKARLPRVDTPPLRVVRFSGKALQSGVEEHRIEGTPVRIYCPAKTVADCFKYRHKVGLDVALEALRDCWRKKLCTMDDLWKYARICRVANVMRPYMESLV
jgi:predicted transcriptional regulator of viral defense system